MEKILKHMGTQCSTAPSDVTTVSYLKNKVTITSSLDVSV